jgi:anti-anti-sigma factor
VLASDEEDAVIMNMDIHVRIDRAHDEMVLTITGDLDLATVDMLTEALHAFQATRFTRVTLDLAKLRFCDCAGLNAFITAHHTITDAGGQLRLTRARPPVRRLLSVAHCTWLLAPDPVLATQSA